jgi:hypothetical protein
MEEHVAEARPDVGGEAVERGAWLEVEAQGVLGDGEGHARAAELAGVHVSVDPHRGARAPGFGPDGQKPQIAAALGAGEGLDAHKGSVGLGPSVHLGGDLPVVEEALPEAAVEVVQGGHGRDCSSWRARARVVARTRRSR